MKGEEGRNRLAWNFDFCCSFSMKVWSSFLSLSEKSEESRIEVEVESSMFFLFFGSFLVD